VFVTTSFGENPSGVNWRGVFLIYGLCGLIAAALFWLIVRDRPPGSSNLWGGNSDTSSRFGIVHPQLGVLARSRNMWLCGAAQFGVNIGWVFVINAFTHYLNTVHNARWRSAARCSP